jgi:iron complex transport system substrate-binding protein
MITPRRVAAPLLALALVACLTSCSQESATTQEITSAKSVSIQATETPKFSRVIAIANGSAEIISAMGHKSILMGRDIASTDKDLEDIEIVTSGHQLVAETILAKRPDLLLIDASTGPAQAVSVLERSGITIVRIPESWSVEDIAGKISAIAQAIGIKGDGDLLVKEMSKKKSAAEPVKTGTRIAFLYLRGGSAIYLIGGEGSGADSLITSIGAIDVGAQTLDNPYNALTAEAMIELNPDVILVMSKGLESVGGVDGLVALPGIAQTSAGKNRKVLAVDDSLLLSFGPRTPDLIAQMAAQVSKAVA